jgi:hypothetical protein
MDDSSGASIPSTWQTNDLQHIINDRYIRLYTTFNTILADRSCGDVSDSTAGTHLDDVLIVLPLPLQLLACIQVSPLIDQTLRTDIS